MLAVKANIDFANTDCIDLGDYNLSVLGDNTHTFNFRNTTLPANFKLGTANFLVSCYGNSGTDTINDSTANANLTCANPTSGTQGLRIRNDAYSSTTALQATLKGVLCAYEKA